MSEQLSHEQAPTKVSPRDLANAIMQRRDGELAKRSETIADSPIPEAGSVIERNGKNFILVPELRSVEKWIDGKQVISQVPYTYRQFYAHTFEEPGTRRMVPGPGWDSKFRLYDDQVAIELHDRTFSKEELADFPANLPDTDCLFVSDPDGGRVAEYEEYLENIAK